MFAFALRRLAQSLPLLLLVSLLVFALLHAAPGGPLSTYLENPNVRPQDVERLRRALGLDRPLHEQYLAWLRAFVIGDWGYSFSDGRPVAERIAERVPATLQLIGASFALALLAAVPAGVLAAARRRGAADRLTTLVGAAGTALPVFWLGLVLQLVFAVALGWLPSSGRETVGGGDLADRLRHLVLPAVVLAVAHAAGWTRDLRVSMRGALGERFIAAAAARGASRRAVVWRHALRVALPPFATVVLLDAALVASGAVVTESIFAWPGVGSLFTESLARRDYAVLMALLMCSAAAVVAANFVADVVHRALDPRLAR
ncbi:MAG TPA: ABC transporter permease [Gemmatimonadaceae bacterium]|nr:ABC transporter permease [Gemmatimonadaceae bacterium]